jgi:hypothetical protein
MPVEVVSRKKSWRILGCKAGDLPCASWFLAHVPEDLKTSTPVFRTPGAATASGNISPILSFVRKAARLASALLWSGCGRRYRHIGGQCDPSAARFLSDGAGRFIRNRSGLFMVIISAPPACAAIPFRGTKAISSSGERSPIPVRGLCPNFNALVLQKSQCRACHPPSLAADR